MKCTIIPETRQLHWAWY